MNAPYCRDDQLRRRTSSSYNSGELYVHKTVYIRLAPGVKVRLGRRGARVGVGPRWLRFWFGKGGRGVSTGAGPVSAYRPGPPPQEAALASNASAPPGARGVHPAPQPADRG